MPTVEEWLASALLEPIDKTFIVEHVTGMGKVSQLLHGDRALTPKETAVLNRLAAQRQKGMPLPYLLGSQDFFGRRFKVSPAVLIPRPDTESLVEWLLENIPKNSRVCDLGTGSGCIAITLKLERPDLKVYASDLSEEALTIAKENAVELGAEIEFLAGSWLDAFPEELPLDTIVSNPPYISKEDPHLKALRYEPLSALTDNSDGLNSYRAIFSQVKKRSPLPSMVAVEHGWDQKEKVQNLFLAFGLGESQTFKDLGGNDRFTIWRKAV